VDAQQTNKHQQQPPKPGPTVLAINICDYVIRDEVTKKVSLVGLFTTIRANSFPCMHPVLHVYVAVTNGHGHYDAEIRFVNLAKNEPLLGITGPVDLPDPLQVAEMHFCFQQVTFARPGEYAVEVLFDKQVIGARKFRVLGPHQSTAPTSGTEVR